MTKVKNVFCLVECVTCDRNVVGKSRINNLNWKVS